MRTLKVKEAWYLALPSGRKGIRRERMIISYLAVHYGIVKTFHIPGFM
jgi:hypothetical protein